MSPIGFPDSVRQGDSPPEAKTAKAKEVRALSLPSEYVLIRVIHAMRRCHSQQDNRRVASNLFQRDGFFSPLLRVFQNADPPICIMMTAYGSVDVVVEATQKPWMVLAGGLKHLHGENRRIERVIEAEFETIEPEDRQ